jgi:hypothetical protein
MANVRARNRRHASGDVTRTEAGWFLSRNVYTEVLNEILSAPNERC